MSLTTSASAHEGAEVETEMRGAITVRAIQGAAAFLELELAWRRLVEVSKSDNPFLSWEWVSAWARHFWDGNLLTLVVEMGEHTLAILPFTVQRKWVLPGLKRAIARLYGPVFVGHMFEMTEPLLDERYVEEVNAMAFDFLFRETDLVWVEMSACSLKPRWQPQPDPLRWKLHLGEAIPLPIMTLQESWSSQWERLGRHVRRKVRHPLNAYSREGRELTLRRSAPDDIEASVRTFLRLHRARSRSHRGPTHFDYFRSRRLRNFLFDVARSMAAAGLCSVTSVEVDGVPVAARLNYEVRDTLYLSFSGFDPAAWSHSPMSLLIARTIEDAMQRGRRSVNFSPGFDPAKALWPVECAVLQRAITVRRGSGYAVLFAASEVYRRCCAGLRQLFARMHLPPFHMLWRSEAPGW